MKSKDIRIVIITGLSGSGKTTALKVLEDSGFYCVDNLPPMLIPTFIELCEGSLEKITRIGLGMDIRGRELLREYPNTLGELRSRGYKPEIVFLESSDEVLVRRFSETRRQHPLAREGSVFDGIKRERSQLGEFRNNASLVINTSQYTVHDLQKKIFSLFETPTGKSRLTIHITSFAYRYGLPYDADIVIDVRFLPNPYFVEELRALSGNDEKVKDFILQKKETKVFLDKFKKLFDFLIPLYEKEGKSNLTIAVGCTGGRHRSVSVANLLEHFLDKHVYTVNLRHRDVDKI
jgi:UPF0042 nucleotide-binding protein